MAQTTSKLTTQAFEKRDQDLADWKAWNESSLQENGAVRLPSDVCEVFNVTTKYSFERCMWSQKLDIAWIVEEYRDAVEGKLVIAQELSDSQLAEMRRELEESRDYYYE